MLTAWSLNKCYNFVSIRTLSVPNTIRCLFNFNQKCIPLFSFQSTNYAMQNPLPACTTQDVLRYRYHHGCNIGGLFVLEKWLCQSAFPSQNSANQTSELAAVTANVAKIGINATRASFEQRWLNGITAFDFDWLSKVAHCKVSILLRLFVLSLSDFEPS